VFLGLLALIAPNSACAQSGQVRVQWVGQDGTDVIGPSPSKAPAPNGVQDIHVRITGLPPGRRIAKASLNGLGGGAWGFNADGPHWRLEIVQPPRSTSADAYFETGAPETGRPWTITLTLDDGRTAEVWFDGGKADPDRRMASAALAARWEGQADGSDRCGLGPSVGPDGHVDARIQLARLQKGVSVQSLDIDIVAPAAPSAPGGWTHGTNPAKRNTAELILRADDPTRADVWFQPIADLAQARLAVSLVYSDGKKDRVTIDAGACDPKRPTAAPPPSPRWLDPPIAATWAGQGLPGDAPGHVRIEVTGLPPARKVAAVSLSSGGGTSNWSRRLIESVPFWPEPYGGSLDVKTGAAAGRMTLTFPPDRDEAGASLALRVVLDDGTQSITAVAGKACDPALICARAPAAEVLKARPGDDLQALVDRGATVELEAGTYELTAPLTINQPVVLRARQGASPVLRFNQPADAAPWTTAIKLRAGRSRLEGFAIRFAAPVRWRSDVSYGPAVIGSTDAFDPPLPNSTPITGIALVGLDIEGPPPAAAPGTWPDAVRLGRFVTARNGTIERCSLRGGTIEASGGPWRFVGNVHRGVPPDTYSPCVFAVHHGHDLQIESNRTEAPAGLPSGKTWRFLVLTHSGFRDRVSRNTITGVGSRQGDTIPDMNMPEIILTESYRLHFEGRPAAIEQGGRLVRIPRPQGDEPPRTGAVVAVLSGPTAGTFARIAQAIDPQTLWLESPIDPGAQALSIATGFVNLALEGNTIDARGGPVAAPLVLVGNTYGLRVANNHFLGGGDAFKIASCATESPVHWGWSHCPMLGVTIEANHIEGSGKGGWLGVEWDDRYIKSSSGRVYLSATVRDNRATGTQAASGPDIRIGGQARDPDAMRVNVQPNPARVKPE
jgi:hypothetical protein